MKRITITSTKRVEVIDITNKISVSNDAKMIFIYTPHTTSAITINEFEPNLKRDLEVFYSKITEGEWRHNTIDDNAEAHIASSIIKPFVIVPAKNGKPLLGTWQSVLFIELDGPRNREVLIGEIK